LRPENLEILKQIFVVVLELDEGSDPSDALRLSYAEWDSLSHTSLVAAMESEFSVSLDSLEAEEIDSFAVAENVLSEKGL
jgi:acyl carrier protein